MLAWRGISSDEWLRFLAGLTVISEDGTTLAAAMIRRAGPTIILVLGATSFAVVCGLAVGFAALRCGCGLPRLIGFGGRVVAVLPVAALAWGAVGWIIGRHGWPIESLLPHHPPPGRDAWELALGRRLWLWLLPCLILSLPLFGEFVSELIDRYQNQRARRHNLLAGLRARGLKSSVIHYRHLMPAVWPGLLDFSLALGLLAFGYAVFVEEALGIPGWGAFFASAIRAGDVRAIAGGVYASGWLAAIWCLAVGLVRRTMNRRVRRAHRRDSAIKTAPSRPAVVGAVLALTVIVLCGFGPHAALSHFREAAAPWAPALAHDLQFIAMAGGCALCLAVIRGGIAGASSWAARIPPLGLLETLSWSPLLVWVLGCCALPGDASANWIFLGLAAAFGGGVALRNEWRELRGRRAVEVAKSLGVGPLRAWRSHVLPELSRVASSWLLRVMASLMIWMALIDSLQTATPAKPAASLGLAVATAKENVLADLPSLLIPAALTAICALCLWQLSRIIQPKVH